MAPETRARVFEPFFTTKPEGTGLGLAIVHGIVHRHRGLVHLESHEGTGTMVRVCLPLATGAEEHGKKGARRDEVVHGGPEVVLVAEDEPALRRLLASTLTSLGYEAIVVSDGEEAARVFAARRGRVALALLDVVMPRLGGLQAYARMREIDPSLRVVFMTGYAPDHKDVGEQLAGGGHALLAKPFLLHDLARVIRETLDGAR
jgi:CheY-like chemotaxis protein